jgi:cobalt-zinc-cadmium efflux system protein
VNIEEVVSKMRGIKGVIDIHHLHVWSICSHISALSAHIDIQPEYRLSQGDIIGQMEDMLEHDYHITHTTLQAECSRCLTEPLIQQLKHRPRHSSLCTHGHDGHEHS